MKDFALIGAAGYVAPRHLKAIKETGNQLVAALDKSDSVGIIDDYFPDASFFVELERFDRHLDKIRQAGHGIDYLSVCSPNYLHDAHIRLGLRQGASVICEKPLVLNPWNVEALSRVQHECGKPVFTILQLRLHPLIISLKEKVDAADSSKSFDIDLTYITSRGNWYYTSWKGDMEKSGGIATNIGIHFFDMLIWIFGKVKKTEVHINTHDRASGFLELQRARVKWFLSINQETLPESVRKTGQRTYRTLILNGEKIEFNDGFSDLHTKSYQCIVDGKGFGLNEVFPSIELTHTIRFQKPVGLRGEFHPFAKKPLSAHPFQQKGFSK